MFRFVTSPRGLRLPRKSTAFAAWETSKFVVRNGNLLCLWGELQTRTESSLASILAWQLFLGRSDIALGCIFWCGKAAKIPVLLPIRLRAWMTQLKSRGM
jgi:hypothetical protein